MDLDAMHTQVRGLQTFRNKVETLIPAIEQFLTNAGHDIGAEAGTVSIGDRVTALETVLTPEVEAALADLPSILEGMAGLTDMAEWFTSNKDRLEAAMDWLDQNKEPLAELTQIGTDMADPVGGTPAPGPGTANAGAGEATGAGSTVGGAGGAADGVGTSTGGAGAGGNG